MSNAADALPVAAILADLQTALRDAPFAVVEAPPGAGKTTLVPLALLDQPWAADRRIVVLEPRRVAARAAAARMAQLHGTHLGDVVGYTTGEDRRVSSATRLEVVTEGILVARLLRDPSLDGVGAVVLDEFHERSTDADLALAFTLEAQTALRPDLRVLVMSATLEGDRIASLLAANAGTDAVTRHRSDGRVYPVETRYEPAGLVTELPSAVADAVGGVLARHEGDVLAFLPGEREIRRTIAALQPQVPASVHVLPLFGALSAADQRRALEPSPTGQRRVVVATDIAESSLTVPGVRAVVDGGYARRPRFDPVSGMSRLTTIRIATDSADQRRGRAARQGPGLCVRLWSANEALAPHAPPSMAAEDLAPVALAVAGWGTPTADLALLDQPPPGTWAAAHDLLRRLDAVDADHRITEHGRALLELPLHPRLAHMVATASPELRGLAGDVAALLADRDILPRGSPDGADLAARVAALHHGRRGVHQGGRARVRKAARRIRRRARAGDDAPTREQVDTGLGAVVATAYPDRIAMARPPDADGMARRGAFVLAGGRGAVLPDRDALSGERFLAVAQVDRGRVDARIHLAAALDEDVVTAMTRVLAMVEWAAPTPGAAADVVAERREVLGGLVLRRGPLADPDPDAVRAALLEGLRTEGLDLLGWSRTARTLRDRLAYLHRVRPDDGWPPVDDATLRSTLETWLAPFLLGARRRGDLARLDPSPALMSRVPYALHARLDSLAPTTLSVPSGSSIRLDYGGEQPVLAVKLQEMFGATRTPTVAGRPVLLHLLSPAQRPVQVTADLATFWERGYPEVRAELRGRYAKHPWPEDPLTATPTRHTSKRAARDQRP